MVSACLHSFQDRSSRFIHNHIHFLQLHYIYIALIIILFSGLYYLQPGTKWAYIDSLYMAATGGTNTGTNSIALSAMSTYQVMVLYFSSIFGSHIVVSLVVVMVRKHYFMKRFREVVLYNKAREQQESHHRRRHSGVGSRPTGPTLGDNNTWSTKESSPELNFDGSNTVSSTAGKVIGPLMMPLEHQHATHLDQLQLHHHRSTSTTTTSTAKDIVVAFHDHQSLYDDASDFATTGGTNIIFADNIIQQREFARQQLAAQRKLEEEGDLNHRASTTTTIHRSPDDDNQETGTYSSTTQPSMDLHSLVELTKEKRYLLGGVEYRALDLLTMVIPMYYTLMILGSSFAFRIYIASSPYAQDVLLTANGKEGPIDPWFMSFFITLSAMNNLGLSLLDASMVPFQNSPFPLLLCGFLVLAGNTAYPIFLRFTLWCTFHATPKSYYMRRETLRYLLDNPRRCYTTLFPARQTWWLLAILIGINTIQVVVYVATNFWLPVTDGVSLGSQLLNALFQAIATRNVDLAALNPGTILVYIVAMYIGVYPVAISMRNSNVYQERSLGMYRTENDFLHDDSDGSTDGGIILKLQPQRTISSIATAPRRIFQQPDFFVMTQIQRQLTKEICWLIIGIFCVCVMEAQSIMSPSPVNIASVIYECVSAFGCVGGSLGGMTPGTSQSADYQPTSKLVIILLMYRGRHRSLPAKIDRAVLLPSEQLERSDTEEQHLYRLHRSPSCVTAATTGFNHNYRHSVNIKVYQRSETL